MFKILGLSLLIISSVSGADSKTYKIQGMKCEDCVQNVQTALCKMPNVTTCTVEMGQATLTSTKPLNDSQIATAVEKAGHYKVTSQSSDVPKLTK